MSTSGFGPHESGTGKKIERLELRSTKEQKELIERAAALQGQTPTAYMRSAILRDAMEVIKENYTVMLSLQEWKRFQELLDEENEPTPALVEAAEEYRRRVEPGNES